MALVDAWDKRTGEKLPHFVPKHLIGHPVLGAHLSDKPVKVPAPRETTPAPAGAKQPAGKAAKKEESNGRPAL